MLSELDNYDWDEVFGEGGGGNCVPITPAVAPWDKTTSTSTFGREDVALIRQMIEGERDDVDWIIYGRLKDGRWFTARAGCDYTGWDCRASNSGDVADTEENLIRFHMTNDERNRFKLVIDMEYDDDNRE